MSKNEIDELDYEILSCLEDSPLNKDSLIASFPDQTAPAFRLDRLCESSHIAHVYEDEFYGRSGSTIYTGMVEITEQGLKALADWKLQRKKERRKLREERAWKFISLLALIVAIISLLQSLHWIHLEKSEILPMSQTQQDAEGNSAIQPPQSP